MESTLFAVCSQCEARLKLPVTSAGKKVRCPKCGGVFVVPGGDEEPGTASRKATAPPPKVSSRPSDVADDEDRPVSKGKSRSEEEDDDDRPRRRRSRASAGTPPWVWMLIGGGAVFLLMGGAAIATLLIINAKKTVASGSSSSGIERSTSEKLVGVWELVKSDDMGGIDLTKLDKDKEYKMTVEFTKDGKFIVKLFGPADERKPLTMTLAEGTYVLDGDRFTTTQLDEDKKERKDVEIIKTLTETELVIVDEKGKTDVFRRATPTRAARDFTNPSQEIAKPSKEIEVAKSRLKTLDLQCQVYWVKYGEFPKLLQLLVESGYVEEAALLDPWKIPFFYDASGPHSKGYKPDIWCTTPDGKVIGNWLL